VLEGNTMTKTVQALALGALALAPFTVRVECHKPRPPVVTIAYNDHRRIDVAPPQRLDVRFTRGNVPPQYRAHWGSDATLAWAQGECLDMGGDPVWHNGQWMVCKGVDY
jgi:hypothetical protein